MWVVILVIEKLKHRPAIATPRGLLPLAKPAAPCKDATDKADERRKFHTLIQQMVKNLQPVYTQ